MARFDRIDDGACASNETGKVEKLFENLSAAQAELFMTVGGKLEEKLKMYLIPISPEDVKEKSDKASLSVDSELVLKLERAVAYTRDTIVRLHYLMERIQ